MKVFFSEYQLRPKEKLNSRSTLNIRSGALIKILDGEGFFGVADLFTWPEFGDETWKDEIKKNSNLYQRSLELASQDLMARKEKKSLLSDQSVKNNYLVFDFEKLRFYSSQDTVKIKGDYNILALAQHINEGKFKVRIDFNSCLSAEEFDAFLKLLSPEAVHRVEYIEDPTVWNRNDWTRWNKKIPLAIDWSTLDPFGDISTWSYLVVKPTRQKAELMLQQAKEKNKKITITSSMGHPVGLMHDLSWVQRHMGHEGTQGLLTLDIYETTDFNSYFRQKNNELNASSNNLNDFGIGMTQALVNLKWRELYEL